MTQSTGAVPIRVTLYSKPDCHLCDVVKATIAKVAAVRALRLTQRSILDEAADYERFKHAVPVVFVEDEEVARYRITEKQLLEAIDARAPRVG